MALNVKILFRSLVDAARDVTGESWSSARAIAEVELSKLAQSASDIERLVREGHIDERRARMLFETYRVAAHTALLTVEAITAATAEQVIGAAIGVIAKAVTRRLGITLI